MTKFYIHIGLPRTATTTIQKYLLPKAKNKLIFQKHAYLSSGKISDPPNSSSYSSVSSLVEQLKAMEPPLEEPQRSNFVREVLLFISLQPVGWNQSEERTKKLETARKITISLLENAAKAHKKDILISTERLADTRSSFICYSTLKEEKEFPAITLATAVKNYTDNASCIITCLRDPVPYLRSKYLRTFLQRRNMKGERDLSPTEFIQKQSILESSYPGTSALFPAIHSEFIRQLQKHSFVKAFGFRELLNSDDVFSLIGLQGEDQIAFRDLTRENKLPFTKEQEKAIEIEITQALKQYGFYDRVMKAQMFE